MQLDIANLWYFKLRLFNLTEIIVWNIYGLHHQVAKILGLEKQNLCQRINFFMPKLGSIFSKPKLEISIFFGGIYCLFLSALMKIIYRVTHKGWDFRDDYTEFIPVY